MSNTYILINSLGKGGAERQVSIIAKHLKIDGVIVLEGQHGIAYDISNIPIIKLTDRSPHKSISNTLYIPIYVWKLAKLIPGDSIIISFLERANFVNILLKFVKGIHAMITERTFPSKEFKANKGFIKIFIKFLYLHADLIISNAYGSKKDLAQNFGIVYEKIEVIRNMYNINKIKKLSKLLLSKQFRNIFSHSSLSFITVGRLTQAKAHWNLLKIFKEIKNTLPFAHLILIGDGELREHLVNYSKELGLKTYSIWDKTQDINNHYDVYFLGIQNNPFQFLAHSSVFLFTSLWEGLPNVVIEALISGLFVLSTDCPSGPSEILAKRLTPDPFRKVPLFSDYGVLMPLEDIEIWKEFIPRVVLNKRLMKKYSIRGKNRGEDFSIDKVVDRWKRIVGH